MIQQGRKNNNEAAWESIMDNKLERGGGGCAINRHRANIWSSTALAVACIRIVRAFMWEPWKEDGVHVECVSYWVCGLCELSARKNQDRHFCPCPSMACLISFIHDHVPCSVCLTGSAFMYMHIHPPFFFFFLVNSLWPARVCMCACLCCCCCCTISWSVCQMFAAFPWRVPTHSAWVILHNTHLLYAHTLVYKSGMELK